MTEAIRGITPDTSVRTIRMVSDMIDYRTREIASLSLTIKKTMRSFHREVSTKKHTEQAKVLIDMTDDLQRLVADNDFDIHHLEVYLQRPVTKTAVLQPVQEKGSSDYLHYIQ